jgi:SAM-dependent methyltransferase
MTILSTILSPPIDFLMSHPSIYSKVTLFLRGKRTTQEFINTYVKPRPGDRILDIGCGPGDALQFLPDVTYYGFDMDAGYIKMAKERYKNDNRARFYHEKVRLGAVGESNFDIVIAMGVIHHLDDYDARRLFELAYHMLKPGGRLVTYDGCYFPNQSITEKFFLDIDRGKYIRTKEGYYEILGHTFPEVTSYSRLDLLMIPYATLVFVCRK